MSKNAEFERFADFLARMIEKYGDEVNLEMTANKLDACTMNEKDKVPTPLKGGAGVLDRKYINMIQCGWDKSLRTVKC